MKKTKLLVSSLTIALILAVTIYCEEQQNIKKDDGFTSVAIPEGYSKSSPNGRTSSSVEEVFRQITVTTAAGKVVNGKVKITMPIEGDGLVAFEITQNIFDETELTPTFWIDGVAQQENTWSRVASIGECLSGCQDIPKGQGRAWCKAGCWLELAAVVLNISLRYIFKPSYSPHCINSHVAGNACRQNQLLTFEKMS